MVEQRQLFDDETPRIYRVHEINEQVRRLLEERYPDILVEGEISNARQHTSGHWYLTLKDDRAQLRAVMFRSDAARLRFRIQNGLQVRAGGRLHLYAPQGQFQLQVRMLVPVGQGELELALQQLKERLWREGLFEEARKRPLPRYPRRVGLITSPRGAAVRDMIATLRARWPPVHILVIPVSVQGDAAPGEIVAAVNLANRHRLADVLIVGRGGGSMEDLWAFNDERVVRALAASSIPVVSAVGHEIDVTLADLVADRRAATPTAAATVAVPSATEMRQRIATLGARLARALQRACELERRRLRRLQASYGLRQPQRLLIDARQQVDEQLERLVLAARRHLEGQRLRLRGFEDRLRALGPRQVLSRGYAYCVDADTGRVVPRAAATRDAQRLDIHFADGLAPARVCGPPRRAPDTPAATASGPAKEAP